MEIASRLLSAPLGLRPIYLARCLLIFGAPSCIFDPDSFHFRPRCFANCVKISQDTTQQLETRSFSTKLKITSLSWDERPLSFLPVFWRYQLVAPYFVKGRSYPNPGPRCAVNHSVPRAQESNRSSGGSCSRCSKTSPWCWSMTLAALDYYRHEALAMMETHLGSDICKERAGSHILYVQTRGSFGCSVVFFYLGDVLWAGLQWCLIF